MKLFKKISLLILRKLGMVRGEINQNDRHGALFKSWGHVYTNSLVGDYVEFGVYQGDSVVSSLDSLKKFNSWFMSQYHSNEAWRRDHAKKSALNNPRMFHCLDTFEGMPDNNEGAISFAPGNFICDLNTVKTKVNKANRDGIEIQYYKGLFCDTKAEFQSSMQNRKIAIANIDCDLQESAADALSCIEQNIDIGTVVLFDDYNCFNADNNKGQRKAFSDFRNKSSFVFEKFFTYHFAGQAFLVVGNNKADLKN